MQPTQRRTGPADADTQVKVAKLRMSFLYNTAFVVFLSVVFYGFAMRAVMPSANTTGEHPIDVVWMSIMIVYGSVVQLGGTGLMVYNYRVQEAALGIKPDGIYVVLAWLVSVAVVGAFAILYPILFHGIKT